MPTYQEVKEKLNNSSFIYADVNDADVAEASKSISVSSVYVTELDGVKYLGVNEDVESLSDLLMPETSGMSFV
jgi:hypothetical protein